ncbi:phospholipase A [Sphingomonas sp.]|uniref:phospholipase A n=1 Tax=Sphingomonas sp. TaxID=28214 RepID=UPI003B00926A
MKAAAFALLLTAAPALADAPVALLVAGVSRGADGVTVDAVMLNDGDVPVRRVVPATIEASAPAGDGAAPVMLRRAAGQAEAVIVPAHGFARVHYLGPVGLAAGLTLSLPAPAQAAAPSAVASAASFAAEPAPYRSADNDGGNHFLANLSAYEPIYAVYGPGTDSDARLQISFKYQLLGQAGKIGPGSPWANGIHFAFTQRLYWNLGAESSPFRNVDYLPELFYLVPARSVTDRIAIGGQFGFRHESNGRAGADSRSFNTIYVQPVGTMPLGDWKLAIGPRLWAYVGSREDNPDIRRYRGNAGLFAEVGQDEGWRLSLTTRLNPGSGKGAVDALVSYPLDRLVWRELKLYAFGQAFAGYGENLLDYDRRTTRLRVGVGLVR